MNATVKRGSGYQGLAAFTVINPDEHRFAPGATVGISPANEEAPGWRAILAGYDADGNSYVVPLTGHFGEIRVRKHPATSIANMYLSRDEASERDECDWLEAKCLALSVALSFGLESRP